MLVLVTRCSCVAGRRVDVLMHNNIRAMWHGSFSQSMARPSLIPLCAFISHAQGSSGAVATTPFVWRGRAKSPTTRAEPSLELALRLESRRLTPLSRPTCATHPSSGPPFRCRLSQRTILSLRRASL